MKLADAKQVTEKLGIGSQSDQLAQADAGLDYATTQIENILDTSLRRAYVQDVFDYFPSKYASPERFSKLQLIATQGFWDATISPQVYLSTDGTKLPANLTGTTALDAAYYQINYEQGTVQLTVEPPRGFSTIALVYTAGYEEGSQSVPEWLQQAAIGYAILNIGLHAVGYNKKDFRDKSAEKRLAAYSVLSQKVRTRVGQWPAFTAVPYSA